MCIITVSCGINDFNFKTQYEDSSESKVDEVDITSKKETDIKSYENDFEIIYGALMSYVVISPTL